MMPRCSAVTGTAASGSNTVLTGRVRSGRGARADHRSGPRSAPTPVERYCSPFMFSSPLLELLPPLRHEALFQRTLLRRQHGTHLGTRGIRDAAQQRPMLRPELLHLGATTLQNAIDLHTLLRGQVQPIEERRSVTSLRAPAQLAWLIRADNLH